MTITQGKIKDYFFILTLTLISVLLAVDISVYSTASDALIHHLNVSRDQFANLTKIRIASMAIGSFFTGMLLEKFYKKSLLLLSLVIYLISQSLCMFYSDFQTIIILSAIASFAKAIPSTLSILFLIDNFSQEDAAKKNIAISILLTIFGLGVPFITLYLVNHINWEATYILPIASAIILFIASIFFIPTNSNISKNDISIIKTFKNFYILILNIEFMAVLFILVMPGMLIASFQYNAPLIISKLSGNLSVFTALSVIGTVFTILASFFSLYILKKQNLDFLCSLGFILLCKSILVMLYASMEKNGPLLLFSYLTSSIGTSFMKGYNVRVYKFITPELRGAASSFILISTAFASNHEIDFAQKFLSTSLKSDLQDSFLPSINFLTIHICLILILFVIKEYLVRNNKDPRDIRSLFRKEPVSPAAIATK